jgi:hypothetical protein
MSITVLLAALSIVAVALVGYREHRLLRSVRLRLLDRCAAALDRPELTHGGDGFPRLAGAWKGRDVRVELIPDTMTIRRLPQLWLSVSLLQRHPGGAGFAILVRPAGTEFYSLTSYFPHRLEAPTGFPVECLVRGDAHAQQLIDTLREPLSAILGDPCVKEVAITERGLRIVRQAGEGKRGEHLLLRQAIFETSGVPREDLRAILDQLEELRATASAPGRVRAA